MVELHDDLKTKLIVRPDEPRHFMRLLKPKYRVTAQLSGEPIASSSNVIKVIEVARDIYEPVTYFPRADVAMDLLTVIAGKSTHCPLKGDTEYFDMENAKEVAWSYNKPLAIARELEGFIAFDATKIELQEVRAEGQ